MAVFGKYVAHSGRDLAANRDAPMTIFHLAALDHNVLRGNGNAAAIVVPSGFDRDAVVARRKPAIFNQDIATRLGIAAVGIRSRLLGRARFSFNSHIPDGNVAAEYRMELPHR
jgi:hypothetical protein